MYATAEIYISAIAVVINREGNKVKEKRGKASKKTEMKMEESGEERVERKRL